MKCWEIIFSPTGGTKKAADLLTTQIIQNSKEHSIIDLTKYSFDGSTYDFSDDSLVILAVPSYGGRVPPLAAERIRGLKGKQNPAVVMCVYGNRAYDDTLLELGDLAKEAGFSVIAGVAAVAEHSILHQYATNRPDETDKKQLKEIAKKICTRLNSQDFQKEVALPGHKPYKKAGAGIVPKADRNCTSCSKCALQCPAGAISKSDPKNINSKRCISCMRCVTVCPINARKVNGLMVRIAGMAIKKQCQVRKECELFL